MNLILWRHAQAYDDSPDGSDLSRALTPKGQKQAQEVGTWLNEHLPKETTILVSPALRTQQTAKALERTYKTEERLAPYCSPEKLLQLVNWPLGSKTGSDTILVVGHQPTLGEVASVLLGKKSSEYALEKAAAWWLRYSETEKKVHIITVRNSTI